VRPEKGNSTLKKIILKAFSVVCLFMKSYNIFKNLPFLATLEFLLQKWPREIQK